MNQLSIIVYYLSFFKVHSTRTRSHHFAATGATRKVASLKNSSTYSHPTYGAGGGGDHVAAIRPMPSRSQYTT
jgi:hypothetical protein